MCSTSVEPRPSTISRPVSCFQPLKTSLESTSAAETDMRSDEKSAAAAPSALVREVERAGSRKKPAGLNRPIAKKPEPGWVGPGSSSDAAPAENGKVMELPKP